VQRKGRLKKGRKSIVRKSIYVLLCIITLGLGIFYVFGRLNPFPEEDPIGDLLYVSSSTLDISRIQAGVDLGYANSVPVTVSVVARCKAQFAQFPYELHVYGTISSETKRGSCLPNKEINEDVRVEANRDNIDATLALGKGLFSLEVSSPFDDQARILVDLRAQIDAHLGEIYGPGNAIDYRTASWQGNGKVRAGATYEVTRLTNAAQRVDAAVLLALGGLIGALIALPIQSPFLASDSKNHGRRRRPILRPAHYITRGQDAGGDEIVARHHAESKAP
jgi:hypothetical protein